MKWFTICTSHLHNYNSVEKWEIVTLPSYALTKTHVNDSVDSKKHLPTWSCTSYIPKGGKLVTPVITICLELIQKCWVSSMLFPHSSWARGRVNLKSSGPPMKSHLSVRIPDKDLQYSSCQTHYGFSLLTDKW